MCCVAVVDQPRKLMLLEEGKRQTRAGVEVVPGQVAGSGMSNSSRTIGQNKCVKEKGRTYSIPSFLMR